MVESKDKQIFLINRKILAISLIMISIGVILTSIALQSHGSLNNKIIGNIPSSNDTMKFIVMNEGKQKTMIIMVWL